MAKMIFKKSLFFAIFLSGFLTWGNARAACVWDNNTCAVSTCNYSSLGNEIAEIKTNSLGKVGAVTIQCPAETAINTVDLTFSMTTGFSGINELIIRGAGVEQTRGSAGQTTLSGGSMIITSTADKKIRITNFTFAGACNDEWQAAAFIRMNGLTRYSSGGGYRVDHNTLAEDLGRFFYCADGAYGLIDANNGIMTDQFSSFEDAGSYGNEAWTSGASLGSVDANYLENNELIYENRVFAEELRMFADDAQGGRVVVRYNTLTDFYIGGHDAGSNFRGGLQYEIYNNKLTSDRSYGAGLMTLRGGTGVVYNNDMFHLVDTPFAPSTSSGIHLKNVRSTDGGTGGVLPSPWNTEEDADEFVWCGDTDVKRCLGSSSNSFDKCTSDSDCGGTAGSCVDVDGNIGTSYPCRDQIGTGNNAYPQDSKPFLFWNNKVIRSTNDPIDSPPYIFSGASTIAIDRDYCTNSTTMPAICNGVATTYVEFTCPHPLTELSGSCNSSVAGTEGYVVDVVAPASPTGLAVS
ncbi:MAG TPA: hypothetical protein PLB52_02620 [Candidatus Moranbacteria bacterium]|nr:hypothetical protein [Candidatus Moranbacteria bacterium]